ncbi:hypothetical protein CANARDRAFT_196762, partial [[Candida] arabinofermentans NRRL YB-2248]
MTSIVTHIQTIIAWILDSISDWIPRIPPKSVSDSRKELRKRLTLEYGYYTFIITIVFILLIPYWNRAPNYFVKLYSRLVSNIDYSRARNNWFTLNLQVIKIIVFWSVALSLLSLLQLNSDVQFLAARLGRVATYCLPTILFLTLRPSPLPHTLYLSLLPIHKWLSRLVILQSLGHTFLYIIFFIERGTIQKIWRIDNLNGVVAMVSFLLIMITSLPPFRRSVYNFFFIIHYLSSWIIIITLYFHVRPSIPYITALNASILIYQIYYRFKITTISWIETTEISNNLLLVSIPNESIKLKSNIPGCHIRMINYNNSIIQRLKTLFVPIQHPYTLTTLPIDNSQKLVVRKGTFELTENKKYLITGVYKPHLQFLKPSPYQSNQLIFQTAVKKCLIVVGGSAISFAIPILRTLNYNGSMVKIVWVIRNHQDLKILDYFKNVFVNDDCIDVYMTG